MDIAVIREFLGWCTIINIGIIMLQAILVIALRKTIVNLHGKMFGLDEKVIMQACYQYFGNYKIVLIVFNMVPYFALKIMS